MEKKENKKRLGSRMLIVLAFLFIVLCILGIRLRGDYLEYLEIGQEYVETFWINVKYQYIGFAIIFIISFLAIYTTTMLIKKGLKQFFKEEKMEMPKLPNKSISFIASTIISIAVSGNFANKLMLVLNSTSFVIQDPIFGNDIGYYMFLRPFMFLIITYAILLIVGLAIYTAVYYIIAFNVYFDSGISLETLKKNTFVKQLFTYIFLISTLIGVSCLLKSQDVLFEKFINLKDTLKTHLYGAGFSSVYVKVWGYRILAFIIPVVIFFALGAFKKGEKKKTLAILSIVPVYLVGMFAVLMIFQIFIVKPNELGRERKYIDYNIEYTKNAYNINIDELELQNSGTMTEEEMSEYTNILRNIPIINEDVVEETLMEYQTNTGYYTYPNTSIAKYGINGEDTLVYISPREIVTDNGRTYTDKTYKYTHGYGLIVSSAIQATDMGQIEYIQKDFVGVEANSIKITEPRIYFGTKTDSTIVVNSKNITEFDYPIKSSTNADNMYDGTAGLHLNFLDRIIVGLNRVEPGLIFTTSIKKDSKILMNRDVIKRASKIAPFLTYDEEPYLVVDEDGNLKWVLDAYTTSMDYPYSQVTTIESKSGNKKKINYIRNSVKVIVDAYNGDMKFYITDRNDPIVMAYKNAYPSLFAEKEDIIPESISEHFIYPRYLYNVQAEVLQRYHDIQSDVLFRNDDVWEYATHNNTKNINTSTILEPYYTLVKTDEENTLGLVVPYTPLGKQNITSYLVGYYTKNGEMKLSLYRFASGSNVLGPMQLDSQIEQDAEVSKELNELNVTGSRLIRNMIVVPVNNTLLYIEPIYQVAINESQVPILKKIIVASGSKLAIGNNLEEALQRLYTKSAIEIEVQNTDDKDELIDLIIKANLNLNTSLNSADWEMIGKDIQKLQALIESLETIIKEDSENVVINDNNILDENGIL